MSESSAYTKTVFRRKRGSEKMRILLLSDEEYGAYWEHYIPGRLKEFDLIISCGDLKESYLSFIATMARCPLLYVAGNHDEAYRNKAPGGCICIDDRIIEYNGVRIAGFGGCLRYRPGTYQFTEREMEKRIYRLMLPLRRAGGVDVLVTHAPPEGLGDAEDTAHRGFAAFRRFIDKYRPEYVFHGHIHMNYDCMSKREIEYGGTKIVNAYGRYIIDIPDREVPPEKKDRIIRLSRKKSDSQYW